MLGTCSKISISHARDLVYKNVKKDNSLGDGLSVNILDNTLSHTPAFLCYRKHILSTERAMI